MTGSRDREIWRRALLAERDRLDDEDRLGRDATRVVELDQQAVGRLSRMDALQGQAMARATARRRGIRRRRIASALARLEAGEFGYCEECGEAIPEGRLRLDPTTPLCVSCAAG